MMLAGLQTFFESLSKLGPRVLSAITIASGVVIFIPEKVATSLGVDEFRASYRGAFGWLFIASISLLAMYGLWWAVEIAKSHYEKWQLRKYRESQLRDLAIDELLFLAPYIREDTATRYAPIDSGVALGLAAKQIIFRPSPVGDYHRFPFNIQPWARQYLKSNPELLEGLPTGSTPDDEFDW